jgi:hypothetical protein
VFENRVLRRIFGSKRDEVTGEWRKLNNEKLNSLYSLPRIFERRILRKIVGPIQNENGSWRMRMN